MGQARGSEPDYLALVLARTRRLLTDTADAEEAALTVVCQFLTGTGPGWLQTAAERTRLDVLTVLEVRSRQRAP